jgi:regulator of sirC expression with transglutaminase-like and TPR domain
MISNEKDFFSLMQLIDDQDEELFSHVALNIIKQGKEILPHLFFLQETNPNKIVQKRTTLLIECINTENITNHLREWVKTQEKSIWEGILLVNQILDPLLDINILEKKINTIKRNVWLELNDYLTPFEQINVINKILYQIEAFQIQDVNYNNPNGFLITQLLQHKKGNGLLMGIFYQIICTTLEIPIELIFTKNEAILRYSFNEHHDLPLFYINPINGNSYTIDETIPASNPKVNTIELNKTSSLKNIETIQLLFNQLALCFEKDDEINTKSTLLQMSAMLD